MDLGTVLSVAQTLFAALQSKELQEVCSLFRYKSQLEDLQRTVSIVKNVLLDAETKQELSNTQQQWIQELKDAVYYADDLFDEVLTVAHQKQLFKGSKTSKKVRAFFSRNNPLGVASNTSQRVKKIRKDFDTIATNYAQFGFSIDPQPIRLRREETCSYVRESDIIGREVDIKRIVGHLLQNSNKQLSFLTVVGIGGLGKTALAQLVYNDPRITSAFPLRIWTCISDHDQEQLCVDQILRKILQSKDDPPTLEMLQGEVRAKLSSYKYLLVLDDVWTESRNQWLKLEQFLLDGQHGSWIVVTTRSKTTASIVGDDRITYELEGLSEENSWCLFKKIAFESEEPNPRDEKVEIGKEIVKGCSYVPLAIRVAGSLLYGQNTSIWKSFQKVGLSNFRERDPDIMPILKFSYHQLDTPLKSCFTYCSLFPKDCEIDPRILKRHWMAQGYIVPLNDGQSMEDAAEEYFSILLRRCFFQDVEYDNVGVVESCKIHDLMHDVAEKVMGEEIIVANSGTKDVHKRARHLACTSGYLEQLCFEESHLRSFLQVSNGVLSMSTVEKLLSNCKCLRVLDLSILRTDAEKLPESLGKLLHLRYLNLSVDSLAMLPKSFIELYNLQTLRLDGCRDLKELPKNFIKLVNLRSLTMEDCHKIKNLTCLGTLLSLRYLELDCLNELEYIYENSVLRGSMSASTPDGRLYAEGYTSYPCLETLKLIFLPELKAWGSSRVEVIDNDTSSSCMTPLLLPQLKSVFIHECEGLNCNLLLPNVQVLEVEHCGRSLQINSLSKEAGDANAEGNSSSSITTTSSSSCYGVPRLRKVTIEDTNVAFLNKMSFQSLEMLSIEADDELESLKEVGNVFRGCSSSLVSLEIERCSRLRSVISGGLEYLSALQTLQIQSCFSLYVSVFTYLKTKKKERMRLGCHGHPFNNPSVTWGLSFLTRRRIFRIGYNSCPPLKPL